MAKIRLEDIQVELEKENWKLISDTYNNLDTEMIFQCPEGHTVYSSWKKLRNKKKLIEIDTVNVTYIKE